MSPASSSSPHTPVHGLACCMLLYGKPAAEKRCTAKILLLSCQSPSFYHCHPAPTELCSRVSDTWETRKMRTPYPLRHLPPSPRFLCTFRRAQQGPAPTVPIPFSPLSPVRVPGTQRTRIRPTRRAMASAANHSRTQATSPPRAPSVTLAAQPSDDLRVPLGVYAKDGRRRSRSSPAEP